MKLLIKHALAGGGLARILLYHGLHLLERHISIELKLVVVKQSPTTRSRVRPW